MPSINSLLSLFQSCFFSVSLTAVSGSWEFWNIKEIVESGGLILERMIHPWEGPQIWGIRHNLEDEISLRQFIRSPGQFDRLTRLGGVFAGVGDLWDGCSHPASHWHGGLALHHVQEVIQLPHIPVVVSGWQISVWIRGKEGSPWGEGIVHWHLCTTILPRENWKGRPGC